MPKFQMFIRTSHMHPINNPGDTIHSKIKFGTAGRFLCIMFCKLTHQNIEKANSATHRTVRCPLAQSMELPFSTRQFIAAISLSTTRNGGAGSTTLQTALVTCRQVYLLRHCASKCLPRSATLAPS